MSKETARLLPLLAPVSVSGFALAGLAAWSFATSSPTLAVTGGLLALLFAAMFVEAHPVPIEGVSSDLAPRDITTFDDLYRYCYLVASVVGLTIIHIFGFDSSRALDLAEKCGIAFQLTNILRDVQEDAANGRIYLPTEDLVRFRVDPAALASRSAPQEAPGFVSLMQFEAGRARAFYDESSPLVGLVHMRSRRSLSALIAIYRELLDRIEASGYDVLRRRIRLPAWRKAWIVGRSAIRPLP